MERSCKVCCIFVEHNKICTTTSTSYMFIIKTFRWVKFEEDVDEGGNRWSKPHIATPALYSLSQLHSCIDDGTDVLDMEVTIFVLF